MTDSMSEMALDAFIREFPERECPYCKQLKDADQPVCQKNECLDQLWADSTEDEDDD